MILVLKIFVVVYLYTIIGRYFYKHLMTFVKKNNIPTEEYEQIPIALAILWVLTLPIYLGLVTFDYLETKPKINKEKTKADITNNISAITHSVTNKVTNVINNAKGKAKEINGVIKSP